MATDDDDPPDTPLTDDDRRAKDLDPAQLAELAAWFDLPSAQVYAEQQARVAEESFEEKEWRETRERRDAAAAAADPALIEYISRHETRPPPFKPLPPVQLVIDEKKLVMDLVRRELDRYEREDPLAQEKPFFIPGDITEALVAHNAPQAILRDLYRPVGSTRCASRAPSTRCRSSIRCGSSVRRSPNVTPSSGSSRR